ncbi:calpain-B-like [Antedon mediterranea]|uniref:calpain-B-like n=1 Tax=Antedon mediterranea TaxID=105859 RepID=UPI003AF4F80D
MAASTIQLNCLCEQKYEAIIADAKYNEKNLFEDPCFKADSGSIFRAENTWLTAFYEKRTEIKWLRPREILGGEQAPLFFKDGASFNEVMLPEGDDNIVNGSFMNALAAVTLAPAVLNFVCPTQSFTKNYKGVFRFRLWRFGKWTEIVVDDRLPTLNGKLMFSRALSKDEFWVSLLEKALAKLLLNYEAMDCSFTEPEALLDLSGGTLETFPLADLTEVTLRSKLKMYKKTGSLVTATLARGADDCGLKREGIFIVSGSPRKIMVNNGGVMCPVNLVRIQSTGRCEWTGPWGDESKEMKALSKDLKEEFGITSTVDGDFWMDLKEFIKRFRDLQILHIPSQLSDKDKKWTVTEHYNKWQKGSTAIGCLQNNKDDFHKNPKYNVKVEGDGDLVIVSIMAVGKRREEAFYEDNMLGIDVFKCEEGATIDKAFIHNNNPVHTVKHSQGVRETTLFMSLDPGSYVVIPSTFKRDTELPFLLRIFSGFSCKMEPVNGKTSYFYKLAQPLPYRLSEMHKTILEAFIEEHSGKDGLMDNNELDAFFKTLKENDIIPTDITHETSAAIATLFDDDDSRQLSSDECMAIAAVAQCCDEMFKAADKDNSRSLDSTELRDALVKAGLYASDTVLYHLVSRYVGSDNKITFDEFLLIVSKIRYIINKFVKLGGSNDKSVAFSVEDIVGICAKL